MVKGALCLYLGLHGNKLSGQMKSSWHFSPGLVLNLTLLKNESPNHIFHGTKTMILIQDEECLVGENVHHLPP